MNPIAFRLGDELFSEPKLGPLGFEGMRNEVEPYCHNIRTKRLTPPFLPVIGRPLFCFHHQLDEFRPKSTFFDDVAVCSGHFVGQNDRGAFESQIVPFGDDGSYVRK